MSESALDIVKLKIQQDYEQELADFKEKARIRRDERLASAEKIFGGTPLIRKPHPTGHRSTRNFASGEMTSLIMAEVESLTPGTRFTIPMLAKQLQDKGYPVPATGINTVFARAFRGDGFQKGTDVSVKLRTLLIEQSTQIGEKRLLYGYERKATA